VASRIPVLGVLLAIKAALLLADPTIRVYLGDSAAYLYGAMDDGRLPDDRSFTYSFILRALVRPFDDLALLGWWQALAGALTAYVLYRLLARRMGVSRRWAFAAACLLALEPAQLYYERMVLAEAAGLLAFVLFVAAAAAYLASRRMFWLPVTVALGLVAASFRLNYLPIVLVISLALPLLPLVRPRVSHLAVAFAATLALHGGYCVWVGQIFSVPPGYLGRAGFMQLGLVLPLVSTEQLTRAGLPADLEQHLAFPIADPHARMRHLWSPGGLIRELRRRGIDVEQVARPLSRMAIVDDPVGFVRLGFFTLADYFRPEVAQHALEDDLGRRVIPLEILWSLREDWGYDASGLHTRDTLVSRYFAAGKWWYVACLFALPVLAVVNVVTQWRTAYRPQALLGALVGIGLVAAHILFVPVALYRYLQPLPFFVLLNLVPLLRSNSPFSTK
jgi:hypothetical protein